MSQRGVPTDACATPSPWNGPGVDAIRQWIADGRKRAFDSLRPDEIGSAPERSQLLSCALRDGSTYVLRHVLPTTHASVALHLLALFQNDTIAANSDDGVSTISAPRMAALLNTHERTVRRLRHLAVELHLLGAEKRPGDVSRYWPIIPRSIVVPHIHPVWWLNATSSIRRGWPAGKPRRPAADQGESAPPPVARMARRRPPVPATPTASPAAEPPPGLDDRSGRLHQALESRVGAAVYGSWFRTVRVESLDGDRLTVSAASPFFKRHIEQEYRQALADAATIAFGTAVRWVGVTVRSTPP